MLKDEILEFSQPHFIDYQVFLVHFLTVFFPLQVILRFILSPFQVSAAVLQTSLGALRFWSRPV